LVLSAWHPWGTVDKRSEIGVAHSRGHAYAIPAVFERGTWIDRVGVQLMSSDANLVIRAALYWPSRADVTSFDAYPGVFYRDLGCSQIASGWNVFSLSEPVYVQPGFWWLVFVGCGNATSYRVREHYTLPVLGLGRTAGDALTPITQVRMGWLETGINSFPPTFPHTHAFLNAPYQDDERLAGWTYYPLSVADVSCGTPPVSSPPPPNTPTPPPAPPFASDSTWHAFGWADQRGATGFGYARGGVYGWPAIFERTTLVDAFGVAALDTSSMAMRLGIYHPTIADARSFDAFPGELHVDAGCRADVQSGFYVFSLGAPAVFSPGLYWLIMVGCGPDTGVTLKLGGPLTTLGMQDNLEPVTGLRMTRFLTGIDSLPTTFPHTPQFLNNAFGQGADPAQWYYRPSSIMG
ncbi:MAG TPA: hypothetical protein VNN12_01550, partial [Dehalococcoidia bacterium]|nr:hypothetical protein [Dehalococcoidia bacterium]